MSLRGKQNIKESRAQKSKEKECCSMLFLFGKIVQKLYGPIYPWLSYCPKREIFIYLALFRRCYNNFDKVKLGLTDILATAIIYGHADLHIM